MFKRLLTPLATRSFRETELTLGLVFLADVEAVRGLLDLAPKDN